VTNWAQSERRVLVDALRALGPDATTACGGWDTKAMAAHLYVRERRLDAAPGVILPGPFASHTDRVMASVLRVHSYDEVVTRVADGPPLALRPFDAVMNLFEFFVHTEDVRRPNGGGPRTLPTEQERVMWRRLRPTLRPMFRRAREIRVELATASGETAVVGQGPVVRVQGPVGELVLYAYNRKDIAEVTITGDTTAVDHLANAQLGT
jgi:uncharacterized protein (TIGR03085 family)